MSFIEWLRQALSDNGIPSSQRLFGFIAIAVISVVTIGLAYALINKPQEQNLSSALTFSIGWLAALGGGTYVGAKLAARNQKKPKGEDAKPN